MGTLTNLTATEFDSMVDRGAFHDLEPKKVELIHGELRVMNPAGPIHDDHIEYLTDWSYRTTTADFCGKRIQCGIMCDDHRPEPEVAWLRPGRYGARRPSAADVLLLIEVADSSLSSDLVEKAEVYATAGITEYWIVDIANHRIHVMNNPSNGLYQTIEIHVPPNQIAPRCRPDAVLNLAELFDVT